MAAFSLTSSGVKAATGAVVKVIPAAETIVAGQAVTGDGYIVDPDNSSRLKILGLAITAANTSSQVVVVASGEVIVTDTLTALSQIIAAPSGQLQYEGDLLTGDYYVILGYTKDANTIVVQPKNTGTAKA